MNLSACRPTVRRTLFTLALASLCLVAVGNPATAHHGFHPQNTYTAWGQWQGAFPPEGAWALQQVVFPGNDPSPAPGQIPQAYFYAHQFSSAFGSGGYIGIQTDLGGKRAIFSWWYAVGGACSDLPGATCRFFEENGPGFQTSVPYNWQPGHYYTLTIWRISIDRSVTRWLGAISDNGGPGTAIGYIDTPNDFGGLGAYSLSWVEWYGGLGSSCADIPKAIVYFERPSANANQLYGAFPGTHWVGDAICPSRAGNFDLPGSWAVHETNV